MARRMPAWRSAGLGHPNRGRHNWLVYEQLEAFLQTAVPFYGGVVYDLGCGLAPYRDFFLRHASGYVGVDWDASQHEPHADVVASLDGPLPIADGAAGTVVCLTVLEHLPRPWVALAEAFRILAPGGALVLDAPFQWRVHEAPADYYRYTAYGLRHLLEEAGFEVLRIEPSGGYFTAAALKFNYFTRRFLEGRPPARWLRRAMLLPLWTGGQYLAPLLDERLDRAPAWETHSYTAIARKGAPA